MSKLKDVCLICFNDTPTNVLQQHNHCCGRSTKCETKFREIRDWEYKNFHESMIDKLSRDF